MEIEESFCRISPTNPFLSKVSIELNVEEEDDNSTIITSDNVFDNDIEFDPISDLENIEKVINSLTDNRLEQNNDILYTNAENDSDLEIVAESKDDILLGSQLLQHKYSNNYCNIDVIDVHKDVQKDVQKDIQKDVHKDVQKDVHKVCKSETQKEKLLRVQLQSELELERQQRIQFQQQLQEYMQLSLKRQFDDSKQIKELKFELLKCKQELHSLKISHKHQNDYDFNSKEFTNNSIVDNKWSHKEFSCIDCRHVMKSEVSMIIHIINHSIGEKDFHLSTTIFKLDQLPTSMVDSVRRGISYSCPRCSQSFNCVDIYYHLYKCHTKEKPLMCTSCNLYCTHIDYLRAHHQEAHDGIVHSIAYANLSENRQRSQTNISYNNNNNGINSNNMFKPYNINLRSHQKPFDPSIPSSSDPKYKLKSISMSSSENTSDDPEIIHLSDSPTPPNPPNPHNQSSAPQKPLSCAPKVVVCQTQTELECSFADCDFKTLSKDKLDFHISAHTNSKFKCPYCPYVGNVLNDIYRHIQKSKKHEGLKIYECRECEFGTNCSSTFKEHLSKKHFGDESDDEEDVNVYIVNMFRNEHSTNSDKSDSS